MVRTEDGVGLLKARSRVSTHQRADIVIVEALLVRIAEGAPELLGLGALQDFVREVGDVQLREDTAEMLVDFVINALKTRGA